MMMARHRALDSRAFALAVWLSCLLSCALAETVTSQLQSITHFPRRRLDAGDLKIYIYTHPPHIAKWPHPRTYWEQKWTEDWIRSSKHYTADGSKADYFWIPYYRCVHNVTSTLEVFKYIREDYPWWNATRNRHLLMTTFDMGPGNIFSESRLDRTDLPADINPASPTRNVIFMHFHGLRDGYDSGKSSCWICFQKGKDIMLPKDQGVCGPLCGYKMEDLQKYSVWNPKGPGLWGPRKHLLFYGGKMGDHRRDDISGRGALYVLFKNRTNYLVVNTMAPDNERANFAQSMLDSEFCYSPLGGSGGPTDRYIAALMFGCIPVFLSTSRFGERMAQPFDELIPWQLFSTTIAFEDLEHLDAHLRMLLPHVTEMRRHMSHFVWQLLYSSRYGPYFGETPGRDAVHMLMRLLYSRLPRANITFRSRRREIPVGHLPLGHVPLGHVALGQLAMGQNPRSSS